MFECGGMEGEGGGQEGENKLKVNESPGCGFLSVLKMGISRTSEPESYLSLVTLLWITIGIINNGCAPYSQKDPVLWQQKIS